MDEALDHKRAPGKPSQRGGMAPQSSKQRQYKDEKFGELPDPYWSICLEMRFVVCQHYRAICQFSVLP